METEKVNLGNVPHTYIFYILFIKKIQLNNFFFTFSKQNKS